MKKLKCWFKTGHINSECLGSIMRGFKPYFVYKCRDCGAMHYKEH